MHRVSRAVVSPSKSTTAIGEKSVLNFLSKAVKLTTLLDQKETTTKRQKTTTTTTTTTTATKLESSVHGEIGQR